MLEYNRIKFGLFLRDAREAAGLTQAQVATRLGYSSPQFISNIERGTSVVPLALIPRMTKLYKLSLDAIVNILMDEQGALLKRKLKRSAR